MLASRLVDDIQARIYAGAPSDDSELPKEQVLHWLATTRDAVVKQKLDSDIANGRQLDSYYMERETCKEISQEDLDCVDDSEDRKFFTLSKTPMSLRKDMGVVKVLTNEGIPVMKARLEQLEMLRDMKYSKPSPTNLTYYRDGNTIVVLGVGDKDLTSTEFIVYTIPTYSSQLLGLTDDLKISDDLLPVILDTVEEIARRELFGVSDPTNDGNQPEVPSEPVKRQL